MGKRTFVKIGEISGNPDEELVYMGAVQEEGDDPQLYGHGYASAEIGRVRKMKRRPKFTGKYPYPPRKEPARVALPGALASRLAQVPGEVYDIFPSQPNATISSTLSTNAAQSEATVHTFTPPTGHYIILDPGDITQEALFVPYTSAGSGSANFIPGLITVYTITGLRGSQQRVYTCSAEHHNPHTNLALSSARRKWQLGYVVSPGDTLETRFWSQGSGATSTVGTSTTVLAHRVLSKKVTP